MCMDSLAAFPLLLKPNYQAHLPPSKDGNTVFDSASTLGLQNIFTSITCMFYKAAFEDLCYTVTYEFFFIYFFINDV